MKLFPTSVKTRLKELLVSSGLRDSVSALSGSFMQSPKLSALRDTEISFERARQLYYNTDASICNGAFFAKPIIDGVADHIGLPILITDDTNVDELLHEWINNEWSGQLWELYRNCMRDTKTFVRLRKPFPSPLEADDEERQVELEIIDADRATPYYNPKTGELIRIEILHEIFMEESSYDLAVAYANPRLRGKIHQILEIITPAAYTYYDGTEAKELLDLSTTNEWGFVPVVEVFNDYDSALNGGTSEIEGVYPFFQAFHDILVQARSAHKYHSDPKIKFKLDDVMSFLKNNFKESFNGDEFTGKVNWQGRDVFFMESEEDVGFIEANMEGGKSVDLLEFVIDCMCIAAEIPEAMLFRAKAEYNTQTDEMFRFKAKVVRKRNNFADSLIMVAKMALKIATDRVQKRPRISWPAIDVTDLQAEATALNQTVTGAEVANRAGVISKKTYAEKIRPHFPTMAPFNDEQNQVAAEQKEEQQQQIDFETKLSTLTGKSSSQNGGGTNGLGRKIRPPLPMDVLPPAGSAGN